MAVQMDDVPNLLQLSRCDCTTLSTNGSAQVRWWYRMEQKSLYRTLLLAVHLIGTVAATDRLERHKAMETCL